MVTLKLMFLNYFSTLSFLLLLLKKEFKFLQEICALYEILSEITITSFFTSINN
jgi:hypothetical protein